MRPHPLSQAVAFLLLTVAPTTVLAAPAIRDKPYDVQSGIMEVTRSTKNAAVTSKAVETVYFKDWGRIEARFITETSSNKFAKGEQVSRKYSLREGTTLTTVDLDKKTGMRMKSGMADAIGTMNRGQATDFTNKMAKAMNTTMKPAGVATVAGKPCEVTESVTPMGNQKLTTRLYIWKNIKLKVESVGMGSDTREEALSVKTDVAIPEDKFKIPAGVTISEFKAP